MFPQNYSRHTTILSRIGHSRNTWGVVFKRSLVNNRTLPSPDGGFPDLNKLPERLDEIRHRDLFGDHGVNYHTLKRFHADLITNVSQGNLQKYYLALLSMPTIFKKGASQSLDHPQENNNLIGRKPCSLNEIDLKNYPGLVGLTKIEPDSILESLNLGFMPKLRNKITENSSEDWKSKAIEILSSLQISEIDPSIGGSKADIARNFTNSVVSPATKIMNYLGADLYIEDHIKCQTTVRLLHETENFSKRLCFTIKNKSQSATESNEVVIEFKKSLELEYGKYGSSVSDEFCSSLSQLSYLMTIQNTPFSVLTDGKYACFVKSRSALDRATVQNLEMLWVKNDDEVLTFFNCLVAFLSGPIETLVGPSAHLERTMIMTSNLHSRESVMLNLLRLGNIDRFIEASVKWSKFSRIFRPLRTGEDERHQSYVIKGEDYKGYFGPYQEFEVEDDEDVILYVYDPITSLPSDWVIEYDNIMERLESLTDRYIHEYGGYLKAREREKLQGLQGLNLPQVLKTGFLLVNSFCGENYLAGWFTAVRMPHGKPRTTEDFKQVYIQMEKLRSKGIYLPIDLNYEDIHIEYNDIIFTRFSKHEEGLEEKNLTRLKRIEIEIVDYGPSPDDISVYGDDNHHHDDSYLWKSHPCRGLLGTYI